MNKHWLSGAVVGLTLFAGQAAAQSLSHSVDVFIALNPSVSVPPDIAGYQVKLDLVPADQAVNLNDASLTSTSGPHPPLFPSGNPLVIPNGGDLIQVTDALLSGSTPAVDGAGLFSAGMEVESTATGTFELVADLDETLLSDELGNPIPFIAHPGSITLDNGALIDSTPVELEIMPDPTTLVGMTLGGLVLLARRRRA